MPILKREADIFPREIFDLAGEAYPWWVARVRSRQEKSLARYLHRESVPFYLPLASSASSGSRARSSVVPLFPGYVFLRGAEDSRRIALRSHMLVATIVAPDQAELSRELAELRFLQDSGASLVPHPFVDVGDDVVVADGPFRGYRGRVVQRRGRMDLLVSIALLRKSVLVEFERESLAPAPVRRPVLAAGSAVA